jgi:hypothetical protein
VPDSLDFLLTKARIRVLQDSGAQGLIDARIWFDQALRSGRSEDLVMAYYGLSFVAMKQGLYSEALRYHKLSSSIVQKSETLAIQARASCMYICLELEIKLAAKQYDDVIRQAELAMKELPLSRESYIYLPRLC